MPGGQATTRASSQSQGREPGRTYLPIVRHEQVPAPHDAVRFLAQAGLGAAPDDITRVMRLGYDGWLAEQRAHPVSATRPYLDRVRTHIAANMRAAASTLPYFRYNDAEVAHSAPSINFSTAWMRNAIFGPDQLRQRMAWVWSQIAVVSFRYDSHLHYDGPLIADYYDTLARHALGNIEDLLFAVATHPAMAHFLSSLGNQRADPSINRFPDENFAREFLQLFTIGLWELHSNGEIRRDADLEPIHTFDNRDVEELARVFTGLWLEGVPLTQSTYSRDELLDRRVIAIEDRHDRGDKILFAGSEEEILIPGGLDTFTEIREVIRALVNHRNTAPYMCRNLIRFLVTSNPSLGYLQRVVEVFVNNGNGIRGDLFAVARAVLLDPEARDPAHTSDPRHGKLQEPMLRLTRLVRAFGAGRTTPELQFWAGFNAKLGDNESLGQWPLYAPSVFNFFSPVYSHLGLLHDHNLASPEFQLLNSVTSAATGNQFAAYIDGLLHERTAGDTPPFAFDFGAEIAIAANPVALADHIDLMLCNASMRPETRAGLIAGIARLRSAGDRVRFAVWFGAMCPEGAVLR
jgi:uncharacterized protein (DUF1800 family)